MPLPPDPPSSGGPRHATVSPDDRGPVVQIVAWIFMVAMVLFTATRLAVRYISAHTPGLDDCVVLGAMFVGVGVIVCLSLAVNDGLGKRAPAIRDGRVEGVEMHVYTATILYLLTLCLAKLSVIIFLARLAAAKRHLCATWALGAVTLAWALAAVLGFAFRCGMPAPWTFDERRCFDAIAFWKAVSGLDILIDGCIVLLPIWILWGIRVARRKKCLVVSLFALRLVAIAASAFRLHYLTHLKVPANNKPPPPSPPPPSHSHQPSRPPPSVEESNSNIPFDLTPIILATAAHAALAVIASCLPALKPFIDGAASGMLDFSLKARGVGGTYGREESLYGKRGCRDGKGVGTRLKGKGKEREREDSGVGGGSGERGRRMEEEEVDVDVVTSIGSVGSEREILARR